MTIDEQVRGYRLLERAGQDGPWAAYLAQSQATGAEVLVRTLACHRVDRRSLKRIVRGFQFPEMLAGHPGIVPVLGIGATAAGRPYLVTPLPQGLTLAERPGRNLPMPPDQARGLARAVAEVLAATHAAGGVHGYVRPENVLVPQAGEPALTGFAMSGLMSIVELLDGTLPSLHVAPEVLEGLPLTRASDVYSLGSMLYELLAGRPAFELNGPGNTARFVLGVMSEEPPPLAHRPPADLAETLARSMAKDPEARPVAAELAAVLSRTPSAGLSRTTAAGLSSTPVTGPGRPSAEELGRTQAIRLSAAQPLLTEPPPTRPLAAQPPAVTQAPAAAPEPHELVWTVDPDRPSIGAPPAPPQPFHQPPPDSTAPPPAQEPEPERGGKAGLIVGASALAVLIGTASVAVAMYGGESPTPHSTIAAQPQAATSQPSDAAQPPQSQPTGMPEQQPQVSIAPSTAPTRTVDPQTVSAHRPKSLRVVTDSGSTVTLAWKGVRQSDYPTVIQQSPGGKLMSLAGGSSTFTVGGLDPATGYCFKVGAVVSLGQPSSVAWSPSLCIRGAAEVGDQSDEVQPPIVLPPATPT